jgi:hypothetical protein
VAVRKERGEKERETETDRRRQKQRQRDFWTNTAFKGIPPTKPNLLIGHSALNSSMH